MFLVVSEFDGIPEVFVTQERFKTLDTALKLTYNLRLERGHDIPWYQVVGSTGVLMDKDYVTATLNEVVAAYNI